MFLRILKLIILSFRNRDEIGVLDESADLQSKTKQERSHKTLGSQSFIAMQKNCFSQLRKQLGKQAKAT